MGSHVGREPPVEVERIQMDRTVQYTYHNAHYVQRLFTVTKADV